MSRVECGWEDVCISEQIDQYENPVNNNYTQSWNDLNMFAP